MNDEPPVGRQDRLHHALIGLHALTRLPPPLVALALVVLAALLGGAWYAVGSLPGALAHGGLYLAAACADWAWLAALPRKGLSYGPVEPSLAGLALARLLLGLALLAGRAARLSPAALFAIGVALQASLSALILYATSVEPFRLGVTRVELRTAKLPPGARLRLVQISDLHVERITRRERALVERVNALEADYILLTGDYLSFSFIGEARAVEDARRVLGSLRARAGIYAVRGTHQVDPNRLLPVLFDKTGPMAGTDIRWLRNEHVVVERAGPDGRSAADGRDDAGPRAGRNRPTGSDRRTGSDDRRDGYTLCFAGASCTNRREIDVPAVERALDGVPPEAFTVLLFHVPDRVREARAGGVDLYLAGHTHGGQIRLPLYGALLTATEAGKRHEMGRYDLDGLTLYVSRGIGMEGMAAPRARFLCPPEIVCFDVLGADPPPDTRS
jgi:predicted MPP superfamily phosphohydrolase